jgi:hypothetical protein
VARSQGAQRQRNQDNPLVLGSFATTSIRYLKGTLGPVNQVVGRADTNQQSNGGYGGGSYNHWYQVNLQTNAWIIVVKAGSRPKYIQTTVYDLNRQPIEGRSIFQADSVSIPNKLSTYYPYNSTAMGAQSDLYNISDIWRLDKGDERYYPLETGAYLICVSTTRNEPLPYEVGVVVEVTKKEAFIQLEDNETDLFITEDGFTFLAEPGSDAYFDTVHDHSLSEWRESWEATHQDTDKFPEAFVPYTNRT